MWPLRNVKSKNSIIPLSICIILGLIVFCERKLNLNVAVLSSASSLKTGVLKDVTYNAENQDHFRRSVSEKAGAMAECSEGRNLGEFFFKNFFSFTDFHRQHFLKINKILIPAKVLV